MATDFGDSCFEKTGRVRRVTFSGWDGKSYNGEGRNLNTYTHKSHPGKEFVRLMYKGSRCYHVITENTHPISGETQVEFFDFFNPLT